TRIARIVRARVVRHRSPRGRLKTRDEIGRVVQERRLRRDQQRGHAERVRRRHRRALKPAKPGAVDLETGEVEKRGLEWVLADGTILDKCSERAPTAVEDVAVPTVPAREVEAAGGPPRGRGGGGAESRLASQRH